MKISSFGYKQLVKTLEDALGGAASGRVGATLRLAIRGHEGQYRVSPDKDSRVPYIVHPVGVARLAIEMFDCMPSGTADRDDIVCAALAHDLLEDTRIGAEEVERVAGSVVRGYVEALTKAPTHSAGESQSSRNSDLLQQIRKAGTAVVFLKACDSMHNLTHPRSTPEALLRKMIDKAETYYLPLVREAGLPPLVEATYRRHIAVADAVLNNHVGHPHFLTCPASLDEALEQAASASSAKILELHDVADILRFSAASSNVVIWRHSKGTGTLTVQHSTAPAESTHLDIPAGAGLLEQAQELPSLLAKRFAGSRWQKDGTRVTTIPMQLDVANRFVVAVEHIDVSPPEWWSSSVAFVLVQFLAHRLIVAATDRRAELAFEAARQGNMRFDIDLALSAGMRASQIAGWKSWLARCEQAIISVESCLTRFISAENVPLAVRQLARVTSRLKTTDSILRKMVSSNRFSWPNFHELEDIAGVRVILPSQSTVALVEELLVQGAKKEGVKLHPTIKQPRRDYVAKPTPSGYRAIHLILEVDTYLPNEGIRAVPCEVQLRTTFQDLWAEISHATVYRASHTDRRKLRDLMKEITVTLDRCQTLTEELIEAEAVNVDSLTTGPRSA